MVEKKDIEKIFEFEYNNIYNALINSYGHNRAEQIFVKEYRKSNIPLAVALRRLDNVKDKIYNLFKPQLSNERDIINANSNKIKDFTSESSSRTFANAKES